MHRRQIAAGLARKPAPSAPQPKPEKAKAAPKKKPKKA